MELSSEIITGIIAGLTGLTTAAGSWFAARRQYRKDDKQVRIDEMAAINKANGDFREEVRRDLDKSNARIAVLETMIVSKDRIILELQLELVQLRKELDAVKRNQ
jgi:hypothetical protein